MGDLLWDDIGEVVKTKRKAKAATKRPASEPWRRRMWSATPRGTPELNDQETKPKAKVAKKRPDDEETKPEAKVATKRPAADDEETKPKANVAKKRRRSALRPTTKRRSALLATRKRPATTDDDEKKPKAINVARGRRGWPLYFAIQAVFPILFGSDCTGLCTEGWAVADWGPETQIEHLFASDILPWCREELY